MPIRSERQRRFLGARAPNVLHAWAHGRHSKKSDWRNLRRKTSRG